MKKRTEIAIALLLISIVLLLACPKFLMLLQKTAEMRHGNTLMGPGLGLRQFAEHHQSLPMSVAFRDGEQRPLLSWRVAILPYIEEEELYKEFRFDEPWDSPHNLTLLPRMPSYFTSPYDKLAVGLTRVQAIVGKGYVWDEHSEHVRDQGVGQPRLGRPLSSIQRDPYETALLVLASNPVPWTAPQDIDSEKGNVGSQLYQWQPYLFGSKQSSFVCMNGYTRTLRDPAEIATFLPAEERNRKEHN
jgi:hypothetical protein